MALEGVVTNVAAFGAFVDIGVHQDGLVHVSELADRFVRDPNEVVKVGDKIKVKVIGVDRARQRISLTARTQPRPAAGAGGGGAARGGAARGGHGGGGRGGPSGGPKRVGGEHGGRSFASGFCCNPFANL